MSETANTYGQITTLDELKTIFAQLHDEALKAEDRHKLLELKERSEYLCTLADSPAWRDSKERPGIEALDFCKRQDAELSRLLNQRARELVVGGDAFRPWREGEDSNATRNL
jgi:hypothetical protein